MAVLLLMHAARGRSHSGTDGGSRGNGGTAGDTTATGGGLLGYGDGRLSNGSHLLSFSCSSSSSNFLSAFSANIEAVKGHEVLLIHNQA